MVLGGWVLILGSACFAWVLLSCGFLNLVFGCVFVGCYVELFVFCVVVGRFCCGVNVVLVILFKGIFWVGVWCF